MKKISAFLVGAGLIASSVLAADPVTSVNIVGYQRVTCETGKWVLVSAAFESLDGGRLTCANVFSNQLPKGTMVLSYDSVGQTYLSDSKGGFGAGVWSTNITFEGGMGFWVYVGGAQTTNAYDVTFAGQVPMSTIATNFVNNGYNLLGYPFTASVAFSNTTLYANSVKGDFLMIWSNDTYISYSKGGFGAGTWPAEAKSFVIKPDMGFWYKSATNAYYNYEGRPYNP